MNVIKAKLPTQRRDRVDGPQFNARLKDWELLGVKQAFEWWRPVANCPPPSMSALSRRTAFIPSLAILATHTLFQLGSPANFIHRGFSAAFTSNQDVLAASYHWWVEMASGMTPGIFCFFVRMAGMLIAQVIVCKIIFAHGRRNLEHAGLTALQWLACIVLVILFAQIPLDIIPFTSPQKSFILAISIFAIGILPPRLAWLLVPQEGKRKIVMVGIYGIVGLLFVIQFLHSL